MGFDKKTIITKLNDILVSGAYWWRSRPAEVGDVSATLILRVTPGEETKGCLGEEDTTLSIGLGSFEERDYPFPTEVDELRWQVKSQSERIEAQLEFIDGLKEEIAQAYEASDNTFSELVTDFEKEINYLLAQLRMNREDAAPGVTWTTLCLTANLPKGTCDTCKHLGPVKREGTANDRFRCDKFHERRALDGKLDNTCTFYAASTESTCSFYEFGPRWSMAEMKFIEKFDREGVLVLEDARRSEDVAFADDGIGYLWLRSKFPFPHAEKGQKVYRLSAVGFWIRNGGPRG